MNFVETTRRLCPRGKAKDITLASPGEQSFARVKWRLLGHALGRGLAAGVVCVFVVHFQKFVPRNFPVG